MKDPRQSVAEKPGKWNAKVDPRLSATLNRQRELLSSPLAATLEGNLAALGELYGESIDFIRQPLDLKGWGEATIVFIEGLCDSSEIERSVIAPLKESEPQQFAGGLADMVAAITISGISFVDTFDELADAVSKGNAVLLADREPRGAAMHVSKWSMRSIEEPEAETVVRGPREGFVETLRVNTSLLRRRLRTPALKLKEITLGRYTKTACVLAYIEGIAEPELVREFEIRLNRFEVDGFMDSAFLEEMIEDNPRSPFPQLQSTERPDVVCANLLDGRVALLTDGSPNALIAPATFFSMMQSPEDYYQRPLVATAIRWLRMLFSLITLFMPSIYVAVLSYHQEMIPTSLLLTISKSREQIPFPALVEALLMEITFEALREAGIRLPKQVGAAVSIVGALVIGQAAIAAGIVSSPMVMVVAITGVSSFLIPNYSLGIAIRLIRFPIMLCAGVLGLYGIVLAGLFVLVHLLALRSFGVPYMSPIAPLQASEWKDTLIRAPRYWMSDRPHFTGPYWNRRRFRFLRPPEGRE
ncbi:spore germination protein [Cohnella fermenti]|uniref:Spore germination protein n=1 Tax=Cohnella fermenti TaxID=2565925 RepID=A0A4S4BPE1_9BACL|nr:spore germination protein [Cohnella fermenti]THF75884.1 spore germination protein [Cohnella fermenti]